jgi:hypothetical protein
VHTRPLAVSKRTETCRTKEEICPSSLSQRCFALCASFDPATAIQPTLEKITPEADGTVTYHFKIEIDETVHVEGQAKDPDPDFFTIFNFVDMVPGSALRPIAVVAPFSHRSTLREFRI